MMFDNDLSIKVIIKHHPINISICFKSSLCFLMLPESNTLTHGRRRQAFTSGQFKNTIAPCFRSKSLG